MSRPHRNRRLSRRIWSPEHDFQHIRPVKRLFTPEIKRMLKDWLIRRRENPYPSRDEKKCLAKETGLTYTQICNWFANWRRKLKNSEEEMAKNSWGMLIKNYNINARGNVEQFSISSEDSIWEEEFIDDDYTCNEVLKSTVSNQRSILKCNQRPKRKFCYERFYKPIHCDETVQMEHSNYFSDDNNGEVTAQCFQISSTTSDSITNKDEFSKVPSNSSHESKTKYKQKIMEKYLRDTYAKDEELEKAAIQITTNATTSGVTELSKWLESAAKFTPNKTNYFVEWNNGNKQTKCDPSTTSNQCSISDEFIDLHHKDELDAAEALTSLAFNWQRQRCIEVQLINTNNSKCN